MGGFSLETYLIFLVLLGGVLGYIVWRQSRSERQSRIAYLSQFDPAELRMSPYRVGLVYQILRQDTDTATVLPIWDGKAPVAGGKNVQIALDQLMPFDPERFA